MAKKLLALAFLILPLTLGAQTIRDTTLQLNIFSFHLSGHLPAGAIAQRYGLNAGVGGSYTFKTTSNWLLSADFTYLYGGNFKEDTILKGLLDDRGYFINVNGEQVVTTISERGFFAGLKVGKVFPVFGPNPNSGLLVSATAGLLQYKTFFRFEDKSVPVMIDDYTKLYDYLTNGFAISQFIGYLHFDNDRPFNFYVGFEFHEAWTRCRRDWLYNTRGPESLIRPGIRNDFLFGLRFGWLFPVGKKTTGTYTYF